MEPLIVINGDADEFPLGVLQNLASMEPLIVINGDQLHVAREPAAAGMLQWSR